ncbi:hypothetical protein LZ32DRAFT_254662 [Colletotrichum eremochloae]|nr:hypothetical protein LZ32DRAFT_254662 [Colletotrichum eremochloae]
MRCPPFRGTLASARSSFLLSECASTLPLPLLVPLHYGYSHTKSAPSLHPCGGVVLMLDRQGLSLWRRAQTWKWLVHITPLPRFISEAGAKGVAQGGVLRVFLLVK